jgi:hypothetical protein
MQLPSYVCVCLNPGVSHYGAGLLPKVKTPRRTEERGIYVPD